MVINKNLKYLFVVIVVFSILCSGYILINPIFNGPDAYGHFAYASYIAKNNNLPEFIKWGGDTQEYIEKNIEYKKNGNYFFFLIKDKYAFALSGKYPGFHYHNMAHHPPIYYLFSSFLIRNFKSLGELEKLMVDPQNGWVIKNNGSYELVKKQPIYNKNSAFEAVIFLRFVQLIYGILIIILLYKILQLILNDKFDKYTVLLISGICFLPSFIFTCSYINNDALAILLGVASIYFLLNLMKKGKSYYGYISLVFAIGAVLTKFHTLTILVVSFIYLIFWLIKKKKWKELLIFVGAIVFIFAIAGIYLINMQDVKIFTYIREAFIYRLNRTISVKAISNLFSKKIFTVYLRNLETIKIQDRNIYQGQSNFIDYFYYSYIVCGIILLISSIKKMRKIYNILIFIGTVIFLIFLATWMYNAGATSYIQFGYRIIAIAFVFILILSLLGYENLNNRIRKVVYPFLFCLFIFINILRITCYYFLNHYI